MIGMESGAGEMSREINLLIIKEPSGQLLPGTPGGLFCIGQLAFGPAARYFFVR